MYSCYIRFIFILVDRFSVDIIDRCFHPAAGDVWHHDVVYVPMFANGKCFMKDIR
jgi:hypothetical protein